MAFDYKYPSEDDFDVREARAHNALLARQFAWRIESALNAEASRRWRAGERNVRLTKEEAAEVVRAAQLDRVGASTAKRVADARSSS